jgi:hypothetical protein
MKQAAGGAVDLEYLCIFLQRYFYVYTLACAVPQAFGQIG